MWGVRCMREVEKNRHKCMGISGLWGLWWGPSMQSSSPTHGEHSRMVWVWVGRFSNFTEPSPTPYAWSTLGWTTSVDAPPFCPPQHQTYRFANKIDPRGRHEARTTARGLHEVGLSEVPHPHHPLPIFSDVLSAQPSGADHALAQLACEARLLSAPSPRSWAARRRPSRARRTNSAVSP